MNKDTIHDRKARLLNMLRDRKLHSEDGLAQLRDLYAGDGKGGEAAAPGQRSDRLLYRTQWVEKPLPGGSDAMLPEGGILIMDTDRSLLSALRRIAGSDEAGTRLILALPGEAFRQTDEYSFELDPSREADYRELMRTLGRQGRLPRHIIYRWSRRQDGAAIGRLAADWNRAAETVTALTCLARSLMEQKVRHSVRLQYVYTVQPEEIRPLDGAVSAFGRSLRMENGLYRFKQVQVESSAYDTDEMTARLASVVCSEAGAAAENEAEVRYRNDKRLAPSWERLDGEARTAAGNAAAAKPGGVYLITGGLGGAGYSVARRFAGTEAVKLVLAGRSELSSAMEEKLRALQELGAEAVYMQADVAGQDEAARLVESIRERYGRLDGIVHCAGVHYDGYVHGKSCEDTIRTLGPKLAGTVRLDEAARREPLDFFIMFSSMAARFGNAGQSDYAYANRVMDLYAEHRNALVRAEERHGVTVSMNWAHWAAGGMKVPEQAAESLRAEAGLLALPERDAVALLEDAIALGETVCFAGYGDRSAFERFLDRLSASPEPEAGEAAASSAGTTDAAESREWLRGRTESLLKRVFEEALKLPSSVIRPNRTFQEYGVDSIMVEQFNQRMERYVGHLPKTLLFEYQTITELTEYMLDRHSAEMTALFSAESTEAAGADRSSEPKGGSKRETARPAVGSRHAATASEPGKPGAGSSRDIAIIGISGRFPGADTLAQFWDNLVSGRDSITEVPSDRWDKERYYDPDPEMASLGKMYCTKGGFLRGVDKFDYSFFSISPREAATMDPQERLFLTLCWEAMEDAGYTRPVKRAGADLDNKVGVFAGVTTNTYALLGPEQWMKGNIVIPNSMPWSIANRVSYHFNFSGPSMPVDTACASGLTAIHLAAESILKGECGMAMAGGVNMYLHPSRYVGMCAMRMLSPNGRCSTFGADADGFVPGEGAGVVLLKPLAQAIADGDSIYGVIKGTAVNHGGTTSGYTVPNPNAQASLIVDALEKAKLNPRTISYIEAHGTGTSLGDPIEIAGLTKAFGTYTDDARFCAIGSVKSNIGHLESAAGMAGLMKVLLQMKHKRLVPTLHASRLNPKIEFERSPFYVQREAAVWEQPTVRIGEEEARYPRRAGISSFGAGGANAHIIVEEYEGTSHAAVARRTAPQAPMLLVLSARNEERLRAYAQKLLRFVEEAFESASSPELAAWLPDAAYTSLIGREPMKARAALLFEDGNDFIGKLQALCAGDVGHEHIYTGMADRAAGEERESEADEAYVRRLLEKRELPALARLWAGGLDLDWKPIYEASGNRKAPFPTYPFAEERCWIRLADEAAPIAEYAGSRQEPPHALIDRNVSTFSAHKFAKHFAGTEFYLEDHLHMLPAVVYMEMARAAGELAGDSGSVTGLRNVVFASPIVVSDGGAETETLLFPRDGETADFEIRTLSGASGAAHAQGTLLYGDADADVQAVRSIDVAAVMRRCEGGRQQAEDYYRHLASIGAPFGPRFQGIGEFYWNGDEALSVVRMPDGLEGERGKYTLHPTYADACLQTVIAWAYRTSADPARIYLPFVVGELQLIEPSLQAAYVYARRQEGSGPSVEEAVYEVSLLDEQGKVAASFRDYSVRPFQPVRADGPVPQKPELLYYRPEWQIEELSAQGGANTGNDSVILLFDDREEMAASLRSRPDLSNAEIVRVTAGSRNGWAAERVYELTPGDGRHYAELLRDLTERYGPFGGERTITIVHAWSRESSADSLSRMLEHGIVSVFHLTQALLQRGMQAALLFVHETDRHEAHPAYAAVGGFASSVAQESPSIRFRTVALTGPGRGTAATAALVAAELVRPGEAVEARYAGHVRQVRRFARHDIGGTSVLLKERGVYIVTGGTGGLGLLFAEHLTRSAGANVVLVGRSERDGRIAERLAALEQLGGQARYIRADIGAPGEAERVVRETRETFGPIDGVLHCAGNVRDGMLANKSWSDMEEVMLPKVTGVMRLGEALKAERLDFFALFSSLSAFGNAGQSDYAYANSFLDYYAARFAEEERFGKLLSVNWPYWNAGGMRLDGTALAALEERLGFKPLDAEAGLQSFVRLLAQPGPQYAVVSGEAERIQAVFAPERADEASYDEEPPAIEIAAAASEGRAETMALFRADLVKLIGAVLELRESEIHTGSSMSEFGFDSITFTELSNKLNRAYHLNLTPAVFFAHETPEAVVRHLYDVYGSQLDAYYRKAVSPKVQVAQTRSKPGSSKPGNAPGTGKDTNAPSRKSALETKTAVRTATHSPAEAGQFEPIAIVGAAGMFPQSDDIDQFWNHLADGSNLVTEIPPDRWDWRQYYGDPKKEPHKTNIIWGAFLNDPASFDPLFFGISPREAERLDPQARKAIETVYRTIEDAGYKPSDLSGTRTGVFIGVSNADYSELMAERGLESIATQSMLANRISFLLNLRGPSEPIDTACSSSLVAIHRAVEAIRHGGCEMALAGGVNMIFSPSLYIYESQSGMLSPDGACKTFDADANGYVRGEGVGAVLLKPLSRAKADGDHIYAVIKGTAVNHGGRASSVTAPNSGAQADLIVEAYTKAGIDPTTVSYIETHGTGTSLGDPVEIEGLKLAFDRLYRQAGHSRPARAHCGLGSVKTNTGHLESASGIAGFIKLLLAMKHRVLPGLIHYTKQNPYIQLEDSPFYLVTESTEWRPLTDDKGLAVPLRAGISSFGIGGVNAHIVLEQAEERHVSSPLEAGTPHLFVLSARNKERLSAYARQLCGRLTAASADGRASARSSLPMEADRAADGYISGVLLEEAADMLQVERESIDRHAEFAEIGLDPASLESFMLRAASKLNADCYEGASGCRTLAELADYWSNSTRTGGMPDPGTRAAFRSETAGQESVWLANAAYTLQVGREAMAERAAFLAGSKAELADKLLRFAEGESGLAGVFAGNVQSGKEKLEWLAMVAPADDLAEQLIGRRDLEALAKLWVCGIAVDWTRLYDGRRMSRMTLPTYPFAKDKYWMEAEPNRNRPQAGAMKPHPLLDYNSSTLRETSYTALLDASGYYFKDHLVGGRPILPGAVYAELAKAAGELAGEGRVSRIENMVWVRPVIGANEPQMMKVALQPEGDQVAFSITGTGETGAAAVFAQGRLVFGAATPDERSLVDLASVKARCGEVSGPEAFYAMMGRIGITFGPSFRSLEWIGTNGKEALSRIRLPESARGDANRYGMHPVLLDGALQTVTGLLHADGTGEGTGEGYLPFSVREIRLFSPLPSELNVYAVLSAGSGHASDFRTFDIWMTDSSGKVLASLKHYLVKRSEHTAMRLQAPERRAASAASATAAEGPSDTMNILRKLHAGELNWEQADRLIGGAV